MPSILGNWVARTYTFAQAKCYVQESPGGIMQGMERKLRLVTAGVPILFSHMESGTNLELTRFEKYRNERG